MSDFDYLRKLFYLAELLEQENAGTANSLAEKLDVSERTVFRYLDELRMKGAVIDYSKSQKSYILKNNFDLKKVFLHSAMKWHTNRITFNTKTDK
ncbi:MAG: helix-turn-helix domain-containing protein [Prolixibacteraceae bacterium]|jgi:predicted DNA-binding transcriptional regulator YafY|nr:helix-turn-helix domain-containing protein [Prolixibacteraceae bacterium]